MYKKMKLYLSLLFFIVLFLFSVSEINAEEYYSDNFTTLSNWNFIPSRLNDENSWHINLDNQLVGEIGKTDTSFLYSKINNFTNFILEFDSKNINGIDQEVLFKVVPDKSEYYLINLRFYDEHWTQDSRTNQVVLFKYTNNFYSEKKRVDLFANNQIILSKNTFYKNKIIVNGNQISFYIDNKLIFSYVDSTPIFTGGIGFWNHGGQYSYSKH